MIEFYIILKTLYLLDSGISSFKNCGLSKFENVGLISSTKEMSITDFENLSDKISFVKRRFSLSKVANEIVVSNCGTVVVWVKINGSVGVDMRLLKTFIKKNFS